MSRPTIVDIARAAGVSPGAVSFALNDRPGVSEATRARIVEIAAQMGWLPNVAARTLAGGRVGALGMVLDRPPETLGAEPYFMRLIAGMEIELSKRSLALVFQVVSDHDAEIAIHRRWSAERRVDGLILVDPFVDDDRIVPLAAMGMPAVMVGATPGRIDLGGVWSDDGAAMRLVLEHLQALGHTRIARVAGSPRHLHVAVRNEVFDAWKREHGLTWAPTLATDYAAEEGAAATRALLSGDVRPTAIVYDNDVMAAAGLAVTAQVGISVPDEVSLVAWDDSVACQASHPALTALSREPQDFGAEAVRLLLATIEDGQVHRTQLPGGSLLARGSTGPALRTDQHLSRG